MKTLRFGLALAVGLMVCASAMAGSSVSIRLVKASNEQTGVDPGLSDVTAALKRNLAFEGYTLRAGTTVSLPAAGTISTLGSYTVRCTGPKEALAIEILKGRNSLLRTTVNLRDRKPLVLGGFPDGAGRVLFVFRSS